MGRVKGLPLRLGDLAISAPAALAGLYVAAFARWVPGWQSSALAFAFIASGPPVLRAIARRWKPVAGPADFLAAFWLLPSAILAHTHFGPVVDAAHPRLFDAQLAQLDLRLFGQHPGPYLAARVGRLGVEAAMVSYYTYYLWPVVVGLLLFFRRQRQVFDEYILALAVFFAANFALYVAVPAIGPRFFLFDEVKPPQGLALTPLLDSLMRRAPFTRDCFPSGHTGITLTVLTYAFLHARRLFYALLPVAAGLVLGTLVGNFHYAIDVLCALPLTALSVMTAGALVRARPEGVVVGREAFALRSV